MSTKEELQKEELRKEQIKRYKYKEQLDEYDKHRLVNQIMREMEVGYLAEFFPFERMLQEVDFYKKKHADEVVKFLRTPQRSATTGDEAIIDEDFFYYTFGKEATVKSVIKKLQDSRTPWEYIKKLHDETVGSNEFENLEDE